ncbi:hypothetical protein P280DRAFT_474392 [Massarina eburnea CBS 473.64]|uniref:Uncharacterized protein n=1 Tax=Massarina eburnea CBS 473.64 TaxID=1395130 RepID=A0A6A6RIG6_9PLEO|nr:hypothetical protein P280DRAFT_474392 [Massarina eburnea CBS 473.64]
MTITAPSESDMAKESFIFEGTFNKQPISSPIPVHILCDDLTEADLRAFPAFRDWFTRTLQNFTLQGNEAHTFHSKPLQVQKIDVETVTWFQKPKQPRAVGFVKLQAQIQNYDSKDADGLSAEEKQKRNMLWFPGSVFLRGGSVGVLILIKPWDPDNPSKEQPDIYTVLIVQPRIAAGSLAFPEIPAGMIDDKTNDLGGAAAKEVYEETGLRIKREDMLNMSELATKDVRLNPYTHGDTKAYEEPKDGEDDVERDPQVQWAEDIADSMYPSVGGCDEFLPLFLCQKRMTLSLLEQLKGRATGLIDEGESITVKVVPFRNLWKEGGRDGKALAALGLYHSLMAEGEIPAWPNEPHSYDVEPPAAEKKPASV